MPTRYSAQAYTPAPRWLTTWETMYRELEPRAVEILRESGFYETNDIDVPIMVVGGKLSKEEGTAIGRIATALTIAADAAHQTSPGIVAAWLQEVAKNPALFRSKAVATQRALGDNIMLSPRQRAAGYASARCLGSTACPF